MRTRSLCVRHTSARRRSLSLRLKSLFMVGKTTRPLAGLYLLSVVLTGCGGGTSATTATTTVATITVTPKTASVAVDQFQTFSATAQDSSGSNVSGVAFSWTSSAPAVASIASGGVSQSHSVGTTQITASASGVTSAPVTLTVTPTVTSVTISPRTATVAVNGTQQFTATALDANGNTISGVVFAWNCSFAGVATIDNNGVATGVAPGTVTIIASASGLQSPPATVTVTP